MLLDRVKPNYVFVRSTFEHDVGHEHAAFLARHNVAHIAVVGPKEVASTHIMLFPDVALWALEANDVFLVVQDDVACVGVHVGHFLADVCGL